MTYNITEYNDPFSVDKVTKLIHFINYSGLSPMERAALLSRYSRSNKSLVDLINTEFKDKNRGNEFIERVLLEYGDDSIAELDSQQIGIEGISMLGASKLTDQRTGLSFLEKSTRYMSFNPDSFYIPAAIFEMELVEDFKDLCGQSYNTFNYLFKELVSTYKDKHPITSCSFHDSIRNLETNFENLKDEKDIKNAEKAYNRALKDKAFDNAGYSWLLCTKTNIGFNANARSLEYLLQKANKSPLAELNDLSINMQSLLSKTIEPFIRRVGKVSDISDMSDNNTLGIYPRNNLSSITSLYKYNIANLLKLYVQHQEDVEEEEAIDPEIPTEPMQYNVDRVKIVMNDIGFGRKIAKGDEFEGKCEVHSINPESFRPFIKILNYTEEQHCLDTLCSSILYENNENLLEYDEIDYNNIPDDLRIMPVDLDKIKAGVVYNLSNYHRILIDDNDNSVVNKVSENILKYDDINGYWKENDPLNNKPLYQDYGDRRRSTINKEQNFLINRYVGDRKTRRDKLGRAFEFIDYTLNISSSFRIMREVKRHRMLSPIYPPVVTARNSFSSFIFPNSILNNNDLFKRYKELMRSSFELYSKIIKKSQDYHTAQYALPLATRCDYILKMNMRELDHFLSLRTTKQAHDEIRSICKQIYGSLLAVHPNLMKLIKFYDPEYYPLGRITAEYKKERKLSQLKE